MQLPTLPKLPTPALPRLPDPVRVISLPMKVIPNTLHSRGLSLILNQLLKEALQYQQLDFLQERCLQVVVNDLGVDYRLTLQRGALAAVTDGREPDVTFGGNIRDLALLALNKEDPDTLFFQRRLQLSGDTELGLEVKNFLYTLDEDFLPATLRQAAEKMLNLSSEQSVHA